jgi:exodeoxyribonuclease V alpha subunit
MATLEGTLRSFVVDEAIARLDAQGMGTVKIVGALAGLAPGELVRVEGDWEDHRKYGPQFRVERVIPLVPATAEGARRYLGSGRVPGIGAEMARRIVAALGAQALEIIDQHPERLTEVPGIGRKRAAAIREALAEKRALREVMVFLQGHGVTPALAARIYKRYGDQSIQLVRQNPYRLAREVGGIGFVSADRIAHELGWRKEAPERVEAGVLHALWAAAEEGHVFTGAAELSASAAERLGVAASQAAQALERLREGGAVVVEGESVFSPQLHQAEAELAARLRLLDGSARRPAARPRPAAEDLARLSPGQRRAVETACQGGLVVVTGGPGTGKTTVTNVIVAAYERAGLRVLLCAPTGRAAKRLGEATGRPARTVHRLLEWDGRAGFLRGPGAELAADLVIVDEASMLDVELGRALALAVPEGATLVLVGDVDQLPSVGPGQVLRDIIASESVPVVRLTEIFRQARESRIVLGAHAINAGQLPEAAVDPSAASDFYIVRASDPARVRELVVRLCRDRIPARFGLDPIRDVQVLAPMRRGEAGTAELGRALQEALNPGGPTLRVGERTFRVGDKVIQTRNDYDRDVYNGDVGIVRAVEDEGRTLRVEIDERQVRYQDDELGELELAYALTVHRAQGSEYPAVVMPVVTQHYVMLQRNLLYTAVTRARKLCVLVGSERALALAVRNAETRMRRTRLAERLRRRG